MNKKFVAIILLLVFIIPTIAYAANLYFSFTQSEVEKLQKALIDAQQIRNDILLIEEYIDNPTYDKQKARDAVADIAARMDVLDDSLIIVNAKLTGESTTYVLNIKSGTYHLTTSDEVLTIKNAIYVTYSKEELNAMGYHFCEHCRRNEEKASN